MSIETLSTLDTSPFKKLVLSFGGVPTDFKESMTYYELLSWLCNYIEKQIIPLVNEHSDKIDELIIAFNQLKEYVDNYFENLDVQEEINNKLDEMAQSGELEAILQQILNTLRVYDTVADMIADEAIQNGQRILCLGYTTKTDNGGGTYTITNQSLTPNALTIIELDNGLFALKEYSNEVVVADQSVLTTSLITELLNNSVKIVTENPIEVTESIAITTPGAVIEGMEFIGNTQNDNYVILIRTDNVTIRNCKISGKSGNYIRISNLGNFANIENNIIDGTDGDTTSALVAWGASNVKIHGNTFINNTGFNTQLIQCKNCLINDNVYRNQHYEGTYISQGGESVLQFNTGGINPARKSLRIDDTITDAYTSTYDAETSVITINLTSAIQGIKTVKFRCYSSLEIININSHCKNITVSSNTLEGSGDSAIVVCRDYHHGTLNPSASDLEDSSVNIDISNNNISDCLYAGVGCTHTCPKLSIHDNIISNCGWGTSGLYSSGIYIPFTLYFQGVSVCNNTISNTSTDIYGETENGIMLYGININPTSAEYTESEYDSYMKSSGRMKVEGNTFINIGTPIKTHAFATYISQLGIDFSANRIGDFGVRANSTTADGNYAALSTGAATASTTTDGSATVINIAFNESGDRYCDFNHNSLLSLDECEVCVGFWAKSDVENSGNFKLAYRQNNVSKRGAPLILTDTWKYYEYKLLVDGGTKQLLLPRFTPTGSCRNIKVRDFQIKAVYYQ